MKSIRSRILLFTTLAAIATAAFIAHEPSVDLGSGFTSKPAYWISITKAHRALRHIWLTSPDGTRTRLSETPAIGTTIIRSNSVVIWVESRFQERLPFQDVYTNAVLAADSEGHRAELTPWVKTRAAEVLPVAPAATLPAYAGSAPAPLEAPAQDPRIGVHSFTPDNVTLAYWRPGITFWCSVPCTGSHRPLAMQVPVDEIANHLRQQHLASSR